jgi:hypothetical protein
MHLLYKSYIFHDIPILITIFMVTDRILEMEKRFDMGKQTTAARRGRIFP